MGYVVQKVEVFQKSGDTWDSTGTEVPSAFNVEVKRGSGKIKNSFNFKVPNGKSFFEIANPIFIAENLVDIYIKRDGTTYGASDRILRGVIKTVNQSIDDNGDILDIKGDDFSEVFFDTQMPLNETSKTWVEISQAILEQLRGFTSKNILWASVANGYSGTANPTVKDDGTSFPQKNMVLNYTRVSEMIEKLTSDEYTEDGQYIWWIEEQSGTFFLVVRFKSNSTAGTLTEGVTSFQTKITKKKEDIKNFVIFNCGTDLYGRAVEDVYYDTTSIGKIGYKTYYATEQTGNSFANIWNEERHNLGKVSLFNPDSDGNPRNDFPTAYNYTFVDGTVVTDDEGFNAHLVDLALDLGKFIAKGMVDRSSKPQYKIQHPSRFTTAFNIGEAWQCVFPSRNIARPLRIEEISYKMGETTVSLIEDEKNAEFD